MALPDVWAHHVDYDPSSYVATIEGRKINMFDLYKNWIVRDALREVSRAVGNINSHNMWEDKLAENPDSVLAQETVQSTNLLLPKRLQAIHKFGSNS
jgi:hypothetical protein